MFVLCCRPTSATYMPVPTIDFEQKQFFEDRPVQKTYSFFFRMLVWFVHY